MKRDYRFIYLFVVAVFVMTSTITAQDYFSNFPVRANPKIVGKKVSSRLMETKHQLYGDKVYIMLKFAPGMERSGSPK